MGMTVATAAVAHRAGKRGLPLAVAVAFGGVGGVGCMAGVGGSIAAPPVPAATASSILHPTDFDQVLSPKWKLHRVTGPP